MSEPGEIAIDVDDHVEDVEHLPTSGSFLARRLSAVNAKRNFSMIADGEDGVGETSTKKFRPNTDGDFDIRLEKEMSENKGDGRQSGEQESGDEMSDTDSFGEAFHGEAVKYRICKSCQVPMKGHKCPFRKKHVYRKKREGAPRYFRMKKTRPYVKRNAEFWASKRNYDGDNVPFHNSSSEEKEAASSIKEEAMNVAATSSLPSIIPDEIQIPRDLSENSDSIKPKKKSSRRKSREESDPDPMEIQRAPVVDPATFLAVQVGRMESKIETLQQTLRNQERIIDLLGAALAKSNPDVFQEFVKMKYSTSPPSPPL